MAGGLTDDTPSLGFSNRQKSSSFNGLDPSEAERLALLLEELGEAQQAIGKILRHGYESKHPFRMSGLTNRESLEKEIGDVKARIDLMVDSGDLELQAILDSAHEKYIKRAYLHHQSSNAAVHRRGPEQKE